MEFIHIIFNHEIFGTLECFKAAVATRPQGLSCNDIHRQAAEGIVRYKEICYYHKTARGGGQYCTCDRHGYQITMLAPVNF